MFEEFALLQGTESFRRVFPSSQLLLSAAEVEAACANIPPKLIPFMRTEERTCPDIYAFDLDSDSTEFRVIVWADHAVVMDWESFHKFVNWVRKHIAKHDTTA